MHRAPQDVVGHKYGVPLHLVAFAHTTEAAQWKQQAGLGIWPDV